MVTGSFPKQLAHPLRWAFLLPATQHSSSSSRVMASGDSLRASRLVRGNDLIGLDLGFIAAGVAVKVAGMFCLEALQAIRPEMLQSILVLQNSFSCRFTRVIGHNSNITITRCFSNPLYCMSLVFSQNQLLIIPWSSLVAALVSASATHRRVNAH